MELNEKDKLFDINYMIMKVLKKPVKKKFKLQNLSVDTKNLKILGQRDLSFGPQTTEKYEQRLIIKVLRKYDHIPNQYGDRFIPRRYMGIKDFNAIPSQREQLSDMLKIKEMDGFWRWPILNNALKEALDIPQSLLKFNETISREQIIMQQGIPPIYTNEARFKNEKKLDWMCKPRSKPLAFVEAVHDLPTFNKSNDDLIDWSAKGQVVAIFNCKLVMWRPEDNVTFEYTTMESKALAFSPSGNFLVIGHQLFRRPTIKIFNTSMNTLENHWKTEILMTEMNDEITSFCWSKDEQYLLCGTQIGYIGLFKMTNFQLVSMNSELLDHTITAMKFSVNSKYLCITTRPSKIIIYLWNPKANIPQKVWSSSTRLSDIYFDWHPWIENEMAIAMSHTNISIFQVTSRKLLSVYSRTGHNCFISALSFNKLTAELVVSYNYKHKLNEILVLGSMDRVVDLLKSHEDIVYYLLWSPDGKKLATVGNDESLVLWNFFGNSKRLQKINKKPARPMNSPFNHFMTSIR